MISLSDICFMVAGLCVEAIFLLAIQKKCNNDSKEYGFDTYFMGLKINNDNRDNKKKRHI